MMEKYGTEQSTYDVLEVIPFKPDDKKLIASNLSLSAANELVKGNTNYMIVPSN